MLENSGTVTSSMQEELRKLLQKYPLIASKNPELGLLTEEDHQTLRIQQSSLYKKLWSDQRKKLARYSLDTTLKKLIEPADRFRDVTRRHAVKTTSEIAWPTLDFESSCNAISNVDFRSDCRSVVETHEKAETLLNLFRIIGTKVGQSLEQPCPVFEDRHSVRVEFLDCIAWVGLKIEQQVRMEVKDAKGNWQLSTFRFDLLKPLHIPSWLDQFLLSCVDELVLSFGERAEKAYAWLRSQLETHFHNDFALQGIRQQIAHHLSVNTRMVDAARAIKQRTGAFDQLLNTEISEMWPQTDFWAELNEKYPDLLLLCHMARRRRKAPPISEVSAIRPDCLQHGLSPSG